MKKLALLVALLAIAGCAHGSNAVMPLPAVPHTDAVVGTWQTIPINGHPYAMAPGRDGGMWMTFNNTNVVSRVDPVTGQQLSYKLTGTDTSYLTPNPDGNMYVAETMADGTFAIAQVTPQGAITEFPLPGTDMVFGIVTASDGAIWTTRMTADGASYVARMDTLGNYTAFVNQFSATIRGLVRGSDKNLWTNAQMNNTGYAVRVSVKDGSMTLFQSPLTQATEGSDGMLWSFGPGPEFVETDMQGVSTTFPVGTNRMTSYATSNHLLWWVQSSRLLGFNTTTHKITKHVAFPDKTAVGLAVRGPDGRIWATDDFTNDLYVYTIP